MKDINQLIDSISDELGIERPTLSLVPMLNTPTQLGSFSPDTNVLYIKATSLPMDIAFTAAHELRHAWQIKNRLLVPGDHIAAGESNVASYNEQFAEIDAHAYAVVVMDREYHVCPTFNGLPEHIKRRIFDRAKQIKEAHNAVRQ